MARVATSCSYYADLQEVIQNDMRKHQIRPADLQWSSRLEELAERFCDLATSIDAVGITLSNFCKREELFTKSTPSSCDSGTDKKDFPFLTGRGLDPPETKSTLNHSR